MNIQTEIEALLKKAHEKNPTAFRIYIWISDSHKSFSVAACGADHNFETWKELEEFVDNMKPRNEILFRRYVA